MLNDILKLDGAQELSKKEQNTVNGGWFCHNNCGICIAGVYCAVQ